MQSMTDVYVSISLFNGHMHVIWLVDLINEYHCVDTGNILSPWACSNGFTLLMEDLSD